MARPKGRARYAQSIGAGVDPEGNGEGSCCALVESGRALLRGLVRRPPVAPVQLPCSVHSSLARPRWRQPPSSLGAALPPLPKGGGTVREEGRYGKRPGQRRERETGRAVTRARFARIAASWLKPQEGKAARSPVWAQAFPAGNELSQLRNDTSPVFPGSGEGASPPSCLRRGWPVVALVINQPGPALSSSGEGWSDSTGIRLLPIGGGCTAQFG